MVRAVHKSHNRDWEGGSVKILFMITEEGGRSKYYRIIGIVGDKYDKLFNWYPLLYQ